LFDELNANRFMRTGLNASRSFPCGESADAHVALPDDPQPLGVFRHVIRAFQNAVLAADALIIKVSDNSGADILFVGTHRTALQASRLEAMVASCRDGLLIRPFSRAAMNQADASPGFVLIETVQGMTSANTCLAARAGVQTHRESALLARGRRVGRNEIAVVAGLRRDITTVVFAGEAFDCRQVPPFLE
jgi:hypothetical protein